MNNIIIINGPNLNLLGEREQSQYGSITFEKLKDSCEIKCKELGIKLDFTQSNLEGELVNIIQDSRKKYDTLYTFNGDELLLDLAGPGQPFGEPMSGWKFMKQFAQLIAICSA